MKMLTIVLAAVILSGMGSGVIEQFYCLYYTQAPLADQSEQLWQRADKTMTSLYGSDWQDVFVGCEKTNRVQLKIMIKQYQTAIEYHRPEHRK